MPKQIPIDYKKLVKVLAATGSAAVVVGGTIAAGYEGLVTKAYRDAIGIPTACIGETLHVKIGDEFTPEQCYAKFGLRLVGFKANIDKCLIKPASLPVKVQGAFLSLAYNIGEPTFCKSSVARYANQGLLPKACDAILLYNKANKRVLLGLVNRRQAERKLCLEGLST